MRNKNIQNQPFDQEIIDKVWEKAEKVQGFVDNLYRKDACGAWISKKMFGESYQCLSFGWEIDHIVPKSMGGTDDISNLQPMQWENNKTKQNEFPKWYSMVTSVNSSNKYKITLHGTDKSQQQEVMFF